MKLLALLLVLLAPQLAAAQDAPWDQVAAAHQVDGWDQVNVISFTFAHAKGTKRHHEWWVKKNKVRVTMNGKTLEIPIRAADLVGDEQIAAHKAFTNDSYWLLFEFHLRWDKPTLEDLGEHPSPLGGKARAFRVSYPSEGGYTPGDAYIAFLGQDLKVIAWSYHPGGVDKPKVTTTRGGYKTFGPIVLPTRFEKPDGALYLHFTNVSVR